MIALFTDEANRVTLIHHQPDLLPASMRATAAVEVESLPPEPSIEEEDSTAVLFVHGGIPTWELHLIKPDPRELDRRATKLAARLTMADKVKAETLDMASIGELIVLFPPLVAGLGVTVGEIYSLDTSLIEIVQSHTTQQDWIDALDASLYKEYRSQDTPTDWVQPTGEHDAYKLGERAYHNDQLWEVTATDANGNNVWEPGVYGWTVVSP